MSHFAPAKLASAGQRRWFVREALRDRERVLVLKRSRTTVRQCIASHLNINYSNDRAQTFGVRTPGRISPVGTI